MLDRNRRIKQHPERFQECNEKFNVVITCEERVYDQVLECKLTYLNFDKKKLLRLRYLLFTTITIK